MRVRLKLLRDNVWGGAQRPPWRGVRWGKSV